MSPTVKDVQAFWQEHPPQVWYSQKEKNSKAYFEDMALHRYGIQYRYIPQIAQFSQAKGKKVLEIGCGVGTDGAQFAQAGATYTGFDLTEKAISTAKERFKLFGLKGTFVQGNAEALPFEDASFDIVYSFGVLHHTPHPQAAFDEVYRVLKPGGTGVIMLYAKGWKHYWTRCIWYGILHLEFLRFGIQETFNRRSDGKSLTYIFSKRKIKQLVNKFTLQSLKKYRMGAFFDWGTTLPRWLVKLCYALKIERVVGENWVVKVRKHA